MKKIYQNPEITVIRVETTQLLSESLGIGDPTSNAAGAESRDYDDWDE